MPPLSPNDSASASRPSNQVWKSNQDWILLFDKLMKFPNGKRGASGAVSAFKVPGQQSNWPPLASSAIGAAVFSSENRSFSPTVQRRMAASINSSATGTPSPLSGSVDQSREKLNIWGPSIPTSGNVGGVEADNFIESFLDVPRITHIVSGPAVEQEMIKISQILSDANIDWNKRVDAIRRLRSMVIAGADIYKEFFTSLRFVDIALQISVKDLRSQVARETCVTLSFFAQQLGQRCDRSAELILPHLISLIPNSAKVISSSAIVTIRFILQNTHSPKLIPIIVNHLQTSRSKDIRRYCCEFIKHMLFVWPREPLEKHLNILVDAVKKGMSDADADARSLSRQAYWHFKDLFPDHAQWLINDLDMSNRKMLGEEMSTPTSSSFQRAVPGRTSLRFEPNTSRIRRPSNNEKNSELDSPSVPRSSSAIDADAVRRARISSGIPVRTKPSGPSIATPIRGRKQVGSQSSNVSREQSPTNTSSVPRKKFVSRSNVVSRESSPEKRSFSGLPIRTASAIRNGTLKKPNEGRGYQSDNDGGSEFGSTTSLSGVKVITSNVPEIIALLAHPNWSTRKEGLLALRKFLQEDRLYLADVDNVRALLTRMMSDPTTKVFSLFLDTLYDFLNVHKLDLGSWLYVLMTRLLGKMSVELLPTVQAKLDRCFELIRCSFSAENQFQQLLKFVNDNLQTPNQKVKAACLSYLLRLIHNNMMPNDFKNTSAVRLGVTKLLNWSLEAKSNDLKKQTQKVVIALHEKNPGEFTSMLGLMDEYLRDTALKMIGNKDRDQLQEDNVKNKQILSPLSPSSSLSNGNPSPSVQSSNEENYNPDDFYTSLKQTTEAIEKFRFHTNLDYSSGEEDRKNLSEDSGFSRHSNLVTGTPDSIRNVPEIPNDDLEQLIDSLCSEDRIVAVDACEKLAKRLDQSASCASVDRISSILLRLPSTGDLDRISSGLSLLISLHSKSVLDAESTLKALVGFQSVEGRIVSRTAGEQLSSLRTSIPVATCFDALRDVLLSEDAPLNANAASFLKGCVDATTTSNLYNALSSITPSLVEGFNMSSEPNVRKECMMALLSIHSKLGAGALSEYTATLPANKIKLLNLYLQKK